jgi:hypothetical protein
MKRDKSKRNDPINHHVEILRKMRERPPEESIVRIKK